MMARDTRISAPTLTSMPAALASCSVMPTQALHEDLRQVAAQNERLDRIDELVRELSPHLDAAGTDRLRALVADGMAILLVEHDMAMVMDVCEQIVVLDAGRVIAAGDQRGEHQGE